LSLRPCATAAPGLRNSAKLYILTRCFTLACTTSTRPTHAASTLTSRQNCDSTMTEAKAGDTVRLHYKGTLDDGSVFDSSEGREPLEFTVGSGQIIPGLDRAIPGMKVGDEKTVRIEAEDAYGPINLEARQSVPRSNIPDSVPLEIGLQLQAQTENGQTMTVTVAEFSDEEVVLDANHPLAGQALTFEIQITGIN